MELPQPPQDEDLRNIIDKLAVFVARNGVEFETMTKQKQRDNPRFAFLFGGEFYNYYMYRVTTEQAVLRHRTMRQQQQQTNQIGTGGQGPFQHFGGGAPRMQQPSGQNPFDMSQNFDRPQQPMQSPFENQGMGNFQQRGPGMGPRPSGPSGSRFDNRNFSDANDRPGNFSRPQGNFEMGPGSGGNFDPGMQPHGNFERSGFDQRQPGAGPRPGMFEPRMMGPGNFEPRQGGNFEPRKPGPGNFDQRQQGPGNFEPRQPGPGNFEQRPPGPGNFEQRPPGTGNFEQRPPGPGNFEQRPPGPGNFEQRPPGPGNFEQRPPGPGNFQGPGPGGFRGNFDQRPPGPGNFDRPGNFEQRPQGPNFDQRPAGPSKFDIRPPGPNNFERGPGNFDRKPGQSRFDAGPSINFEPRPNFDPRLGNQIQQATLLPQGFKVEPGLDKPEPRIDSNQAAFGPGSASVTPNPPTVVVPTPAINVEVLTKQKIALEEQIRQSEQNLAAQQQVLLTSQQTQIDDAIRQVQDTEMSQLAAELNVDLVEFDMVLQPIIESCTKDAISGGKSWIFTHSSTPRHYHLITSFLLKKTMDPAVAFNQRLHIIYLVNDVLHHCMRKGAEDLQQALESMVIPMFCYTKVSEAGNEENIAKLDKLFNLWETKSNYVGPVAVEKLRNFNQTLIDFNNDLMQRHALVVTQIANSIQQTFDGYQTQHKLFCQHVSQSLKTLEQQIQQGILQDQIRLQQQQQQQQQAQQLINPMQIGLGPGTAPVVTLPPGSLAPLGPMITGYPGGQGQNLTTQIIAPPYIPPGNDVGMFDLSKPPPGFPTPPPDKDLIPALPYYELPAGLMVQLVKLEDDSYKPVDPKSIRLPPPCPPSDRLIQAVEAFYAQPSHERPRDSEGWERLGLYEYFKAKNLARKQKEDDIREGRREKSRSPSPIRRDSSPNGGRSPPRRRYQSKSPTPQRSSRRRSRSRSPTSSSSSSRRKKSRRSRSRSRSPRRSPTPPSFAAPGLGLDRKLDESNKGHQLLKKMGWSGMGLGINEQGIEAPISGGEIRERKDQYKGVGVSVNDPFESYRKSKGQAFVERMRARAEERL